MTDNELFNYVNDTSKHWFSEEVTCLPLDKKSYEHLREKIDGRLISKVRYVIPIENGLVVELDHFESPHKGLYLAEIEFSSVEEAEAFPGLPWFAKDVTYDINYHNSVMSGIK